MRLLKLQLHHFRRFSDKQTLLLNEDLIALVGPNEAGKSSILHALNILGRSVFPEASDATRNQKDPAEISVLFALEDNDRAQLANIHDGDLVTHLWVDLVGGAKNQVWRLESRPGRDLRPRQRCYQLLAVLKRDPELSVEFSTSVGLQWDTALYDKVLSGLISDAETLEKATLDSFKSLADFLKALAAATNTNNDGAEADDEEADTREAEHRQAREEAAATLSQLIEFERKPPPVRQVLDALKGRLPEIAVFAEEDRNLQREYKLTEVAANPPFALDNLCALANLDLAQAKVLVDEGRIPHLERIFEIANTTLKERFQATWSQSTVHPKFGTPSDGILRIFISTDDNESYSYPEERSDGLRWFMALHAFLLARGATEPILLVDEAETHLHYDAQADLIDALMRQRITSKVIYTTHSVGCLPPDLGCGIRAIIPERNTGRSKILNSYWKSDCDDDNRIGYTPLLFAMGARLLAFTVPRYGVIVEGPADAILLPSLLREAAALMRLPYRIVPGLAELAGDQVSCLHHQAGKMVCLVDGDGAGQRIRKKLTANGIPNEVILDLGEITPGCTLEDLVVTYLFSEAVNKELDTWAIGPLRVKETNVPPTGRWKWLKEQGIAVGTAINQLSKVHVAQRMVDLGRPEESTQNRSRRVEPRYYVQLNALHQTILETLGIPDSQS